MSVRVLPRTEDERYLTRQEFADLLGVHVATVDRHIAGGMDGVVRLGRAVRIRPSLAVRDLLESEAA